MRYECPVCGHQSEKCWRCTECGKLLNSDSATIRGERDVN
jgi:uncharacterized membrane protein YvbJ